MFLIVVRYVYPLRTSQNTSGALQTRHGTPNTRVSTRTDTLLTSTDRYMLNTPRHVNMPNTPNTPTRPTRQHTNTPNTPGMPRPGSFSTSEKCVHQQGLDRTGSRSDRCCRVSHTRPCCMYVSTNTWIISKTGLDSVIGHY